VHVIVSLLVLAACAAAAAAAAAHRDTRRGDRLAVGALALLARIAVGGAASAFLAFSHRGHVFPDEEVYLSEARAVRGGAGLTPHGYSNLLGILFKATAPSAWLPRAINILAGAALAVVVFELASLLVGSRGALLAGAAVALWPSLVLWSVVVLKDSLTLLAVFSALLGAAWALRAGGCLHRPLARSRINGARPRDPRRRVGAIGALVAVVAMAALEGLRPYAFVVASISVAVGLLVRAVASLRTARPGRPIKRVLRRAGLAGLLVVALGVLGLLGGEGFLGIGFVRSNADTEVVAQAHIEGSAGGTGFNGSAPRSARDIIGGVPRGLLFGVLGPFPWDAGQTEARALLVVELPLWYLALGAAVSSLLRLGWRRVLLRWAMPLAFASGVIVVLAVFEANAGTALRQRAMVIPLVLTLSAIFFKPRPAPQAVRHAPPSVRLRRAFQGVKGARGGGPFVPRSS
jgi:hypothetical protein